MTEMLYVCNDCGRIADAVNNVKQEGEPRERCKDGKHNWQMLELDKAKFNLVAAKAVAKYYEAQNQSDNLSDRKSEVRDGSHGTSGRANRKTGNPAGETDERARPF